VHSIIRGILSGGLFTFSSGGDAQLLPERADHADFGYDYSRGVFLHAGDYRITAATHKLEQACSGKSGVP
jgi:hypothetical protein